MMMRSIFGPWGIGLLAMFATRIGTAGEPSLSAGTGLLPARPPGPFCPIGKESHRGAPTWAADRPIVATTYFYWYDVDSKAHIVDPDGTDALTTHPADMDGVSYKRRDWHERQLRDMIDAGIDVLLPVFWGYPGDYKTHWSYVGLEPLVRAHDALSRTGAHPPMIGLFYDTSSLRHNRYQGRPTRMDLRTALGKDWFYTSIRDFFSMIPPRKWARVNGKPIAFLYSASFAEGQDPMQFDYVRRRFSRDFGCELYLVRHTDWKGQADAWYSWGGALGLKVGDRVAALGPGYDHSAVPGRSPLIVDRRGGAFYRENWERLLSMDPRTRPFMVHVETWNEWHEGTDIAPSAEYGRQYIDLTRRYGDLFHRGVRMRPAGRYADVSRVAWTLERADGLTLRPSREDGQWSETEVGGQKAVVSQADRLSGSRYLYYRIDDSFIYDAPGITTVLTVTYLDRGCERFRVEYDNVRSDQGPVGGAFREAGIVPVGRSGKRKTATLRLVDCRFANRANEADLRLAVEGGVGELTVLELSVARVDP